MRASVVVAFLACVACGKSSAATPEDAAVDAEIGGGVGDGTRLGKIPAMMQFEAKVISGDVSPELIERVVRSDPALGACYRRKPADTTGTAGIEVKAGPSGKSTSVTTTSTTFDADITSCLTSAVGGVTYPSVPSGIHFTCEVRFDPPRSVEPAP